MYALLVTFELDGIGDAAYRRLAEDLAPGFLAVPGLVAKTWLADEGQNTYGGFYLFADEPTLAAYLASDALRGLAAAPFRNLRTRRFGALDAPTWITATPRLASLAG